MPRWGLLGVTSLLTLLSWIKLVGLGAIAKQYFGIGLLVAVGVAGWAMMARTRHKWPAVVILLAISPLAWILVNAVIDDLPHRSLRPIEIVCLLGTFAIPVMCIANLVRRAPPPPDPPISPVRIVDR